MEFDPRRSRALRARGQTLSGSRWGAHLALFGVLALATATPARAWRDAHWTTPPYTVADTEAAMAEHSALANCIVDIETGHTLDPYAVGREGELGVAQLHPRGLLPDFYARGYANPYSPYQAMDYLEDALARGEGPAWTAYWWCG